MNVSVTCTQRAYFLSDIDGFFCNEFLRKIPKALTHFQFVSSNSLCQAKYSVHSCFYYAIVQLTLVNMQQSYHASLCVALYLKILFCLDIICIL
jgi:hypothetical protein